MKQIHKRINWNEPNTNKRKKVQPIPTKRLLFTIVSREKTQKTVWQQFEFVAVRDIDSIKRGQMQVSIHISTELLRVNGEEKKERKKNNIILETDTGIKLFCRQSQTG
uniref:(northern house mosquito) hypothetical protein n=1 Tax=Culex pipiens TaxID=7175 RepID=A0A8D8I2I2_CULPI